MKTPFLNCVAQVPTGLRQSKTLPTPLDLFPSLSFWKREQSHRLWNSVLCTLLLQRWCQSLVSLTMLARMLVLILFLDVLVQTYLLVPVRRPPAVSSNADSGTVTKPLTWMVSSTRETPIVLPVFVELNRLPPLQVEEVQKTMLTVFPLELFRCVWSAVAGVSGLAREHSALQVSSFARGREADCAPLVCAGVRRLRHQARTRFSEFVGLFDSASSFQLVRLIQSRSLVCALLHHMN